MGYSVKAGLTYGYDIADLASKTKWWDEARDCCDPHEHAAHILQQDDPRTIVRSVYNDISDSLLLVAYFKEVSGNNATIEIGQLPGVKDMNMDLLWALSVLGFDMQGQRPQWRLSAKYR